MLLNRSSGVINVDLTSSPTGEGIQTDGTSLLSNLGRININGGTFFSTLVNSGTLTVNGTSTFNLINATHNANSVLAGTGNIG